MNRLVMVLAASMLVVCIVAAHLWMELRSEREQHAARIAALESAQLAMAPTPVAAAPEPARAAASPANAPAAAVQPQAPATEPARPRESTERARNPLAAGISAMMNSPEGREMTRAQIRSRIGQQFPDLARELNLTPEEAEKMLDLLARQAADTAGTALGMLGGAGDRPSAQDLQRVAAEREQANRAELAALLGNRMPQWEQYQAALPTRQQVNRLSTALGAGPNALTEAQSRQLISALAAEQARITQDSRARAASGSAGGGSNPIQEQLQRRTETNRRLAEVAAYHLNPQQLEIYQRQQEQEMNMARIAIGAISGQGGQGGAGP